MKPSERFYELAMPVWQTYFDHPFVRGIGNGTLDRDKFRYYMIQDHKYLMQYAKVFALGLVKATDEGDMRMYSDLITATLDTENAVHQAYLKELDVTPEAIAATPMALNNKSYTDYMIAQASKGGLPEIAGRGARMLMELQGHWRPPERDERARGQLVLHALDRHVFLARIPAGQR